MFKYLTYLLCFAALLNCPTVKAQQKTSDTTNIKKPIEDNVITEKKEVKYAHSPKKAGWMSAALPGLGQAYNKKWWKIPIVYAAMGTSTGFIVYNQRKYKEFRSAYIYQAKNPLDTTTTYSKLYTTGNLREIQDTYHNWRDISIIVTAGFYVLNILDAVVDAHFFRYDMSDDLSIEWSPTFSPGLNFVKPGFNICLRF